MVCSNTQPNWDSEKMPAFAKNLQRSVCYYEITAEGKPPETKNKIKNEKE